MATDYIPYADSSFLTWEQAYMLYLSPRHANFGVPEADFTDLSTLQAAFEAAYALVMQPSTKTAVAVVNKDRARSAFEKAIRVVNKRFINLNPTVTDGDRLGLGLPIYKTGHTPAPVATRYPDYDIDSSLIRHITLNFYDQDHATSKAKPPGQHGAEIRWALFDVPSTEVTIEQLTNSSFDTHSPFTLEFTDAQRRKMLYFVLRWENTRGEKGPWSEIGSAVVP
jgi:hypothetical protein